VTHNRPKSGSVITQLWSNKGFPSSVLYFPAAVREARLDGFFVSVLIVRCCVHCSPPLCLHPTCGQCASTIFTNHNHHKILRILQSLHSIFLCSATCCRTLLYKTWRDKVIVVPKDKKPTSPTSAHAITSLLPHDRLKDLSLCDKWISINYNATLTPSLIDVLIQPSCCAAACSNFSEST